MDGDEAQMRWDAAPYGAQGGLSRRGVPHRRAPRRGTVGRAAPDDGIRLRIEDGRFEAPVRRGLDDLTASGRVGGHERIREVPERRRVVRGPVLPHFTAGPARGETLWARRSQEERIRLAPLTCFSIQR
jgi:hypothetical protein